MPDVVSDAIRIACLIRVYRAAKSSGDHSLADSGAFGRPD